MNYPLLAILLLAALTLTATASAAPPTAPKIDWVQPLRPQPFEKDRDVIWYDAFDSEATQKRYAERNGELTESQRMGSAGSLPWTLHARGQRGSYRLPRLAHRPATSAVKSEHPTKPGRWRQR